MNSNKFLERRTKKKILTLSHTFLYMWTFSGHQLLKINNCINKANDSTPY